jgi:GNAT acetyltransferase-like protein
MTGAVEIYEDLSEAADWDEFIGACGAPIFYSSAFLSAYREAGLQGADTCAYLMLRDGNRSPLAALPVTLQQQMDPVGVLAAHEPEIAERPVGLLSHVWHCYDTWLPSRPDDDSLRAMLDGFRACAADLGAPWYGLVNVDATGPLAAALDRLGARGLPIDERYVLDLPPNMCMQDYLAGLTGRNRAALLRQQRRAADAGARVRVVDATSADLDAHLVLVRLIGAKHGVEDFYPEGVFQDFQRRLGDAVRIVEVWLADRLVGVGICMVDGHRLHFSTCGVDYAAAPTFSPFYVLFFETMREAIRLGVSRLECGRRNGALKRRFGLRPIPLLAYVSPAGRHLWQPS